MKRKTRLVLTNEHVTDILKGIGILTYSNSETGQPDSWPSEEHRIAMGDLIPCTEAELLNYIFNAMIDMSSPKKVDPVVTTWLVLNGYGYFQPTQEFQEILGQGVRSYVNIPRQL